jgi:ABC-type uncharacterized transport system YnjBCD ATPase subunit
MATLLEVRNVSCAKDDEHTIFSKLDFDVNEGDVVVVQGKSGSGYGCEFSSPHYIYSPFRQQNHLVEVHRSFERI